MVKNHKPTMLVLLETRMSEHKILTEVFNFDSQFQSAAAGLFGGMVIIWKNDVLNVGDISITPQSIHVSIQINSDPNPWFFTAIYASTDFYSRIRLWEKFCVFPPRLLDISLLGATLMKSLGIMKVWGGGGFINNTISNLFRKCLDQCRLLDLGFKGGKFTWTNKRYKNRQSLILERLDRCLANNSWTLRYPKPMSPICPGQNLIIAPFKSISGHPNHQIIRSFLEWISCGVGTHHLEV
ncbi:hypothetical protein R3W88_019671 [Solanum pinnatisectum]|uniref:Uncharacterized protein n=1 Tax=Solanum pinnatisectum TaxID=50273 RepID=A0AAV9KME6_9SOLN|nr:hypothetical protein R3W88_019671 [Solanum pinnatisectum]